MAIPGNTTDRINQSYVESTSVPGKPVQAVANPDGSNLGSGTGPSSNQMQGASAHDAPVTENPMLMGGYASAAAPSDVSADADKVRAWLLRNGAQAIYNAYKQFGEDTINDVMKTEQQFSALTISTATTTPVKAGTGLLHSIVVTGGTAGTIVGYDSLAGSGSKLFDFDSTNALGTYIFNARANLGITIVTSAATKLTVNFR